MVKKLILLAIAVFYGLVADAQVVVNRDGNTAMGQGVNRQTIIDGGERVNTFAYKFGIKAGLNMSNMSNNLDGCEPGFSMGTGFRVGGLVNMRWGQRTENSLPGTGYFGLQPEILFSSMQVKTDVEAIKFQTVQVPIMLKVYPTVQFSIEAGPEFTYYMSSSPDDITFGGTQIKTGDIKGLTLGVGGGLAYDFDMGLTIGARYSYGFNKMAKNLDWKNSNIQITVGWMF